MNSIDVSFIDYEEDFYSEEEIQKLSEKVLRQLGIDNWELSILITSSAYIQELNKNYRGIDAATDVLSFEQERFFSSDIYYAGDLVLSPAEIKQNTVEFGVEFDDEFLRLLIHGILHLSGMSHKGYEPDQEMLIKQEEILTKIKGNI
ncbi:MAG: rRNA maturation RNase YbeY [Spirochaetales bacterium]|nr:rRNA maturation RNase YbeY [Spirochaetales bacterium]